MSVASCDREQRFGSFASPCQRLRYFPSSANSSNDLEPSILIGDSKRRRMLVCEEAYKRSIRDAKERG